MRSFGTWHPVPKSTDPPKVSLGLSYIRSNYCDWLWIVVAMEVVVVAVVVAVVVVAVAAVTYIYFCVTRVILYAESSGSAECVEDRETLRTA